MKITNNRRAVIIDCHHNFVIARPNSEIGVEFNIPTKLNKLGIKTKIQNFAVIGGAGTIRRDRIKYKILWFVFKMLYPWEVKITEEQHD